MRLFSYILKVNSGAAPNPFWGICTLVICKPVIRRVAKPGDWVVGLGSKNSPTGDISNQVIYAMKITNKMSMAAYDEFCKKNYPNKIPDWKSKDYRKKVGDCIYDFSKGEPKAPRKSVHGKGHIKTDLSGKNALISNHFYYFGNQPKPLPTKSLENIMVRRGHKSKANAPFVAEFVEWIEQYEVNKLYGEPQYKQKFLSAPHCSADCAKYNKEEAEEDERICNEC